MSSSFFFFFKLCWCLIVLVKVSVWWRVAELSAEPLVARWPLSDGCCGSALFSSILLHILRCIVMYLIFVHFHLLNSNSCSLAYQISSHIPQQHPGLRCVIASSVFLLWGEKKRFSRFSLLHRGLGYGAFDWQLLLCICCSRVCQSGDEGNGVGVSSAVEGKLFSEFNMTCFDVLSKRPSLFID